jgi:hypothetical protein
MLTHQDRAAERTSGTTGDNTRDNYDRNHQKPDVPKKRKLCKREFKHNRESCQRDNEAYPKSYEKDLPLFTKALEHIVLLSLLIA